MCRKGYLVNVDTFDTIIAMSSLEMAFRKCGVSVNFVKGGAAAQEILLEGY